MTSPKSRFGLTVVPFGLVAVSLVPPTPPGVSANGCDVIAPPDGAFYLYIRAPGAGRVADAGSAFATYLLEKCDVAVVPGAAFFTNDWVRISYAAEQSLVDEAMRRIVKAYDELA